MCRHGQDEDNVAGILNGHRDKPLSELGQKQAAEVATLCAKEYNDVQVILSSPLQRAKCTADAIGASLKLGVTVNPQLIERDFGDLTGTPISEIPQRATELLKTEKVTYFLDGPNAESFDACYARAQKVLKAVDEAYTGQVVLLVCHGDLGKMLLACRRGMSWRDALQAPYIANTEVLKLY